MIALAVAQFGLLLALEGPARRALNGLRLWTPTVLINSMIMTLYLWHVTVLVLVLAALFYAGAIGLTVEPASAQWWLSRPLWVVGLFVLLLPVALLLGPFERRSRPKDAPVPSAVRQIGGAALLSLGVALIAMYRYAGAPLPGLDVAAFVFVIVGAAVGGLLPSLRSPRSAGGA